MIHHFLKINICLHGLSFFASIQSFNCYCICRTWTHKTKSSQGCSETLWREILFIRCLNKKRNCCGVWGKVIQIWNVYRSGEVYDCELICFFIRFKCQEEPNTLSKLLNAVKWASHKDVAQVTLQCDSWNLVFLINKDTWIVMYTLAT